MNITYSNKTKRTADAYSLTPEELAFADLMACGWDSTDAYFQAFHTNFSWTAAAISRETRQIMAKVGVKQRIREKKTGRYSQEAMEASNMTEDNNTDDFRTAISKEQILKDLIMARRRATAGSKDWQEMTKQIADIARLKQEEVKTEDNTVHYYLPLQCYQCGLWLANKKKKEKSS